MEQALRQRVLLEGHRLTAADRADLKALFKDTTRSDAATRALVRDLGVPRHFGFCVGLGILDPALKHPRLPVALERLFVRVKATISAPPPADWLTTLYPPIKEGTARLNGAARELSQTCAALDEFDGERDISSVGRRRAKLKSAIAEAAESFCDAYNVVAASTLYEEAAAVRVLLPAPHIAIASHPQPPPPHALTSTP